MPEIPVITVITPEQPVANEIDWLRALFEEGLECLWMRKPGLPATEVLKLAEGIRPEFHARILWPCRLWKQIGVYAAAYGLHFPEEESTFVPEHTLKEMAGAGYRLSTSVHDTGSWDSLPGHFSQAFVSPVSDSISKSGYKANPDILAIPERGKETAAVALGGMHAGNVRRVLSLGFDGVAVLGAIWQSDDPVKSWRQLQKIVTDARWC